MTFADRVAICACVLCCLFLPAGVAAQSGDGSPEQDRVERLLQELVRATAERDTTRQELERLKRRVEELENAKAAPEDAARSIIRQAFSELGTKLNELVDFGGTLEVSTLREEDYRGQSEQQLGLDTAELDFEVSVNEWVRGSFILEYIDGKDAEIETTDEYEVAIDRMNIDTAFLFAGDPQRIWPYGMFGRMIVPFGISTGDPVADVLTIEDPLTVEVFESREDALLFGLQFPTPPPVPATPMRSSPPVKPLLLSPLLRGIGRLLGHKPFQAPPPPPSYAIPVAPRAMFNAAMYTFGGDTFDSVGNESRWNPGRHLGASIGLRTQGNCRERSFCSWGMEINVDWNNSIFDSSFLSYEYRSFLRDIGHVPGMAASIQSTLGPVGLVGDWNGAVDEATFKDDLGKAIIITPSAWQVALAYQFGWTPAAEAVGAQGTYVTVAYSESRELAGVTRIAGGDSERVGSVPYRRFAVGAGEWITDGFRLAAEYVRNVDYPKNQGGTGQTAQAGFLQVTYEW